MIPRFAAEADADLITSICSHPEVRKWTAQDGAPDFDVKRWLHPNNMVVLVEGGCFLSNWLGDQTFGVHTNFLPQARGRNAIVSGTMALMLGFLASNAESFLTMVPENNRSAAWFTKVMGFRPTFTQQGRWKQGGKDWKVTHYRLDIDDWILQGHLIAAGRAFHKQLEGLNLQPAHADDWVHDCYVGTACAMIAHGKVGKAVKIYNRWALSAGYSPMKILSQNPLRLDLRDFDICVGTAGDAKFELKEKDYA